MGVTPPWVGGPAAERRCDPGVRGPRPSVAAPSGMVHRAEATGPPSDELSELLEVERRLAALVATARDEAAAVVAAARAEAASLRGEAAAATAAEVAQLEVRAARGCRRRLAAAERMSRQRRRRWQKVADADLERAVEALVAELVSRLAGEGPP